MIQRANLLLIVWTGMAIGCGSKLPDSSSRSSDTEGSPHSRHNENEPFDWVKNPPPLDRIDFDAMKLEDDSIREAIPRWENAAAKMHDASWHHESWYRIKQHWAVEWWSTTPQFISADGLFDSTFAVLSSDVQLVRIECGSISNVFEPHRATLSATWKPKTGWGALLYYSASDATANSSILAFDRHGKNTNRVFGFNFFLNVSRWEHQATFHNVQYTFQVESPDFRLADLGCPLTFEELRKLVSSEAAFREAGMKRLDHLEDAVKAHFQSTEAIKMGRIRIQIPGTGTHGGNPPRYDYQPVERPLSAKEKQTILDAALSEIAGRREIFRTYSADMYHALEKAFPLKAL